MTAPPSQERKAREPIGSEFWAPEHDTETVAGYISRIGKSTYGEFIELAPVLQYGGRVKPGRYGSINVGLNSWLQKLVKPSDVGKFIVITYRGKVPTPSGKMRTFDVYDSTRDELRRFAELIERGESPEIFPPTYKDMREKESHAVKTEDDLPF